MRSMRIRAIELLWAWISVLMALGIAAYFVHLTDHPWLLASLGGSCVILFGMPDSDMAQPRSLIGGHVISTLTGLIVLRYGFGTFGGPLQLWMIVAVASSLVLMMATRTIHSPAGANPIVVFLEGAGWSFLLSPLLLGLAVLLVVALIANNLAPLPRRARFPRSWH
jgi:CBS-domain-containing membrane protein